MAKKVYVTGTSMFLGKKEAKDGGNFIIDEADYRFLLDGLQTRNLDRICSISLAAALLALKNAKFSIAGEASNDYGLMLGTEYGSLESVHSFDMVSVEKGALSVNPALFPQAVLNSIACQIEIQLAIAGPVYTVCNGYTSALDAIGLGYNYIQQGLSSMVLAGGVDELAELQRMMHKRVLPMGEACGFLVLESGPPPKRMPQIAGYNSLGFSEASMADLCKFVVQLVLETIYSAGFTMDTVGHISLGAAFAPSVGQAMMQEICKSMGYNGACTCSGVDWLGASGLVQTVLALEDNWLNPEKRYVVVNVDSTKASVLLLV